MSYELENPSTHQIEDKPNATSTVRIHHIDDPLLGSGSFCLKVMGQTAVCPHQSGAVDPPADCVTCRICMYENS